MADIYSALIGANPTALDKQAAIADVLRRKGAFGLVGQLSGDPVLMRAGEGMGKEALQMGQMLQQGAQNAQQFGLEQQRTAQANANAQTGFDLQRSAQALAARGQDLDYAEALARSQATKDAAAARSEKLTDAQAAAKAYLNRMRAAEKGVVEGGYKPSDTDYVAATYLYGSAGPLSGVLANKVLSPAGQKHFRAAADWVRAKLRKESGAVITPTEMTSEIRTYFPLPDDDEATIAAKAAARKEAERQLETMSGGVKSSARVKVDMEGNPIGN